MRTPKCPKCAQPMDEGFLLDYTHNNNMAKPSEWVEGAPKYSFWTGLNLGGRGRRQVATYCCPKCGFLESYAKPPEVGGE